MCKVNYAIKCKINKALEAEMIMPYVNFNTFKDSMLLDFNVNLCLLYVSNLLYTNNYGKDGEMRTEKHEGKLASLSSSNCLNPSPDKVRNKLFSTNEFFDPRDLVQVKYEMLRSAESDGLSVAAASRAFGFTRPTFYQVKERFGEEGIGGLMHRKRGPREAHKLSGEIMAYVDEMTSADKTPRMEELALSIENKFGVKVHPRSIERAMGRRQKKGLLTT
jgi:transposase